jgi:hypothetical protein
VRRGSVLPLNATVRSRSWWRSAEQCRSSASRAGVPAPDG